jgi:hypothetical protein
MVRVTGGTKHEGVAKIATRVNVEAPKSARLDAKKFSAGLFNVRPSTTWRTKDHPAHQLPCGGDLYLDQQAIDTTTPAGKLMFQITGAFAEFERSMIRTRVNAGLKRAKDQIKQKGHFVTKHGEVKKRLGRPNADPDKLRKARAELAKAIGINRVAKTVGLGVGTVAKLKNEMLKPEMAAAA